MKKAFLLSLALLMGLSLVACGTTKGQDEIIESFENENKDEKDNDEVKLTFNLESSDDKTVITYTDKIKVVYYHDDEKVTDMEYYMDCGSVEQAQDIYNAYRIAKTYDLEEVDSFEVKGQYIIINYNENGYEAHTLEELKELEESYKQLQELYALYQ